MENEAAFNIRKFKELRGYSDNDDFQQPSHLIPKINTKLIPILKNNFMNSKDNKNISTKKYNL